MLIRFVLIGLVVIWLSYEYASPFWIDLWTRYNMHIKFAAGICVVFVLLCSPSIEDLAIQNPSIYALIRQYAVDDKLYVGHGTSRASPTLPHVHMQNYMQRGMALAEQENPLSK